MRGGVYAGPRPQRVAQPQVGPHLEAVLGAPEDHHQQVEQPRRQVPDHQPVHAHEGADGVVRDVEHREDDVDEGEEEARQQEDDHGHQHPLPHHVGLGIKLLTLCRKTVLRVLDYKNFIWVDFLFFIHDSFMKDVCFIGCFFITKQ